MTTERTVCLLAGRRLRKGARTSCRSGSETTIRRTTTAGVQGISPIYQDGRIVSNQSAGSQPDQSVKQNRDNSEAEPDRPREAASRSISAAPTLSERQKGKVRERRPNGLVSAPATFIKGCPPALRSAISFTRFLLAVFRGPRIQSARLIKRSPSWTDVLVAVEVGCRHTPATRSRASRRRNTPSPLTRPCRVSALHH